MVEKEGVTLFRHPVAPLSLHAAEQILAEAGLACQRTQGLDWYLACHGLQKHWNQVWCRAHDKFLAILLILRGKQLVLCIAHS